MHLPVSTLGTPIRKRKVGPTNHFLKFNKEEVEQGIPARFEQQVRQYPDRIAVRTRDRQLSYDALNRAANRVAHALLAQRGEGAEPIALLLGHDAPLLTALLGVLKAGKIYVPLDPAYPRARTAQMLEDSQARVVVTDTSRLRLAQQFARGACSLLNLDEIDAGSSTENPGLSIGPDAFAYILYTSGSTGQPKGVVENHRNVLHFTMNNTNACHLCADDRLTLLVSGSFSASATPIYGALLNGAALCPLDVKTEGVSCLADWLVREEITVFHGGTVFRHFTGTLAGWERFPSIRLIYCGGEPLRLQDVDLYRKHFSRECLLLNALGAAEMKCFCQYFIDQETPITGSIVPVGYPLEDIEVLLLDAAGGPVRLGEIGEMAVKTRYLAPAYWGRPELTLAKFQAAAEDGSERIYRTGDLGRMLPDGCLLHLGRKDSQVKIRGFRIEVAEIEAALLALDGVREAVVIAGENRLAEPQLVAYLVPGRKPAPTVSALRRALAERLPEPMLPSFYVLLESLPLNPNGKVDRGALPAQPPSRPELEQEYVPPRNLLEQQIIGVWEKALGIRPIGIRDSFFDLGGHSVLAARVMGELEGVLGRELPLRALFHAPTVEQLAGLLAQKEYPEHLPSLLPVQSGGSRPPFFCISNLGGNVDYYRSLSHHLGPDQPLYALHPAHPPDLDGRWNGRFCIKTRIKDTAAHYIREIRTLQPEGPYYLGGYCLGGTVAFEMAQQFRAQGHSVGLLALFEPSSGHFSLRGRAAKIARYHLTRMVRLGPGETWAHVRELAGSIKEKVLPIAYRAAPGVGYLLPRPLRSVWRLRVGEERDRLGGRRYVPQPYPGRAAIFWSAGRPLDLYQEVIEAWRQVCSGGIELIEVPGDHATMLAEPHIGVLAAKIDACLEKARAESARRSL